MTGPAPLPSPDASTIRILIIGDVVGRPGRDAVTALVPRMREAWDLDVVIGNVENAAAGSGITQKIHRELDRAGIDLMTLGDHAWKRADNVGVLQQQERVLRPHNYPEVAAGTGAGVFEIRPGLKVGLVTVIGRIFLEQADCPFLTVERTLASFPDDVTLRVVEIHAEATSEKIAIGHHFDGRASVVFGTHTHVQTADDRVLPRGTAYITDLGMTGPHDGVIGRDASAVIHKFTTSMHAKFTVATGDAHLCGVLVDVDSATGRARSIRRVDVLHGSGLEHGSDRSLGAADLPEAVDSGGDVEPAEDVGSARN